MYALMTVPAVPESSDSTWSFFTVIHSVSRMSMKIRPLVTLSAVLSAECTQLSLFCEFCKGAAADAESGKTRFPVRSQRTHAGGVPSL